VTLDLGDVVLRIKGPTLAQTHELTKVAKALDFSGAITAAKPVFDAARGTTGGGFIGALVAELPTLIPAVADAVGRVAADAMFEAAIALLDTRHNLGRVIRACAVEGADASDLPIDIDSADAVEAPDGTYLEHPGLRRWLRAERELRNRINRQWLLAGVTMLDPRQTFLDVTVTLGRDVTLYPGTILQGDTVVGDGSEIGPDTRLVDCRVGAEAVVEQTVGHDAEIGEGAHVGPYAHLPVGSAVAAGATTGAFYTAPTA
jgi:hypothetical protein